MSSPVTLMSEVVKLNERIGELSSEIQDLSAIRKKLIAELYEAGYSHAKIGEAVGLSSSRVFQILREPAGS